ncbi:MAG: hypothetical protein K8I30_19910, partial [Anaerolineae bacterium]|nr:hypothetical protein [Anaerolineae bacterium]
RIRALNRGYARMSPLPLSMMTSFSNWLANIECSCHAEVSMRLLRRHMDYAFKTNLFLNAAGSVWSWRAAC